MDGGRVRAQAGDGDRGVEPVAGAPAERFAVGLGRIGVEHRDHEDPDLVGHWFPAFVVARRAAITRHATQAGSPAKNSRPSAMSPARAPGMY
ncbi:hypothetical protein GCM10009839_23240 [Catenulispora yoronensis]|uniref:Uncharacterized protein n=1 Tax=Catenulispora yoronensis TaxID=450799 RepID=A0ABN2U073_9ACTN